MDFTETVAFLAGQKLVSYNTSDEVVSLRVPSFNLGEQVTQFVISIDLYSSKGRYGFGTKTIKSSTPVFAKFTTPTSLIIGDALIVPVTVYNSRSTDAVLEYSVVDRELGCSEGA
jgi:uncharacterized protein YfaS (alpha-2-macroglobulin family)